MASPCTNDPNEVISAVVGIQTAEENFEQELDDAVDTATENADKFDKFVNGTNTQTVQLGQGSPTPTIRNTVRQMLSAAAELPNSDVSGKISTANGGETMRTLAERFADVVNVKDYGAKGDGTTDDATAIEAALNVGKDVFFPHGLYRCSRTITVDADVLGYNIFTTKDSNIASSPAAVFNGGASLVFDSGVEVGLSLENEGMLIDGLGILGPDEVNDSGYYDFKGIVGKSGDAHNPDDTDHCFRNMILRYCDVGIEGWGRSVYVERCRFIAVSYCVSLNWDEETYLAVHAYDNTQSAFMPQTPPYANRAVRILNNRMHGFGPRGRNPGQNALVLNNGDILRSARIQGNLIDIGGTLIVDNKGMENCLVCDNITDMRGDCDLLLNGKYYATKICNNIFSRTTSKTNRTFSDNTQPVSVAGSTCYASIYIGKDATVDIDGIEISGNIFNSFTRNGILLAAKQSASDTQTVKNIVIQNNLFDISYINSTNACGLFMSNRAVDGFVFEGNIATGTNVNSVTPIYGVNTIDYISNALIRGNYIPGLSMFRIRSAWITPKYIENENNNIKIGNWVNDVTSYPLSLTNDTGSSTYTLFIDMMTQNKCTTRVRTANDTLNLVAEANSSSTSAFYMLTDSGTSATDLGKSSYKWNQLYANTGTINTSDKRVKQQIQNFPPNILEAWADVELKQFAFNDAVAKKGESARLHSGIIAQQVQEAFSKHGVDANKYGFFCYDSWDDEFEEIEVVDAEAVYDENDNLISPKQTHVEKRYLARAGEQYSIRYEEALIIEAAYQRHRAELLESRIATLEARLNEISGNSPAPSGASPDNL